MRFMALLLTLKEIEMNVSSTFWPFYYTQNQYPGTYYSL